MKKLACLFLVVARVTAQPLLPAHVLKVSDGDTIRVRTFEGVRRIRLDSIDAPEKNQAFGKRSRQALQQLLPVGASIHILDLGQDRYRRTLGQIYLPDGANVNALQVRNGYAWVYTRYCRDQAYWIPLQREAQQNQRGLWYDVHPVAPWEFRHRH